jgi:hypothetical protein
MSRVTDRIDALVTDRIDALIDDYLAGKRRFMSFWTEFMDLWAEGNLSGAEEEAYSAAYDVVYMGAEGPVPRRDSAVGLLSESEVKARLRDFRTRHSGAAPA